jgi:hypothetical protein
MATVDPVGFTEPHQSTVVEILRAVQQKLFTADEANILIDRLRALATGPTGRQPAVSTWDSRPREDVT